MFKVLLNSVDDDIATSLLQYIRDVVRSDKWQTSKDIFENVFNKGKTIMMRHKVNTATVFVVLRVLKIIREECSRVLFGNPELEANATNLLFAKNEAEVDIVQKKDLKEFLMEALEIFSSELNESETLIRESALGHIGNEEVVLVYGYSELVLSFLTFVVEKKRFFNVIVLEGYPSTNGILMTEKLAKIDISVTFAPERCSMTLLAKVDKVLLDCDTVFSDGAIISKAGTLRICMDAYTQSVPVVVCAPTSNCSPLLSIKHEEPVLCEIDSENNNVLYTSDLIPAKFISTFVTNIGSLDPSRILSISKDYFYTEDVNKIFNV